MLISATKDRRGKPEDPVYVNLYSKLEFRLGLFKKTNARSAGARIAEKHRSEESLKISLNYIGKSSTFNQFISTIFRCVEDYSPIKTEQFVCVVTVQRYDFAN
jgi:hypothetical protein